MNSGESNRRWKSESDFREIRSERERTNRQRYQLEDEEVTRVQYVEGGKAEFRRGV